MTSEGYYVQAQINLLELQLALTGEIPKRSGDFETTYKTESGKEVVVKRSPDGKFASKGGGDSQDSEGATAISIDKTISKSLVKASDELAKLPSKVQADVHKLMFDSEFSRGIDKAAKSIVDKIKDPNLTAGFNLGQRINDELAKKPFSKFSQTIADEFAKFRQELPQKTDDLKKEIVRISKDPNTSATIATGVLMALAGYYHLGGVSSLWRAGAEAFKGLKIMPGLVTGVISPAEAIAQQAVSNAIVGANLIASLFQNTVAAVLASAAGKVILDRVKANAKTENDLLKQEILAKKENSDALYQQHLEQQAKDAETRKKILEELSKDIPKKQEDLNPKKPETLAGLPVLDIKLTDDEEAFAADPKRREQILATAYKDEEVLKLAFLYMEAQGLALVAALSDKKAEEQFVDIREQTKNAISEQLTVVIKAEIKRLKALKSQ